MLKLYAGLSWGYLTNLGVNIDQNSQGKDKNRTNSAVRKGLATTDRD